MWTKITQKKITVFNTNIVHRTTTAASPLLKGTVALPDGVIAREKAQKRK